MTIKDTLGTDKDIHSPSSIEEIIEEFKQQSMIDRELDEEDTIAIVEKNQDHIS